MPAPPPAADLATFCAQGSPYAVTSILDTIRAIRAPVSTVGFGMVGGTAAAVLAAGAKGRRFSMENTRILLQQPMGGLQGSAGAAGQADGIGIDGDGCGGEDGRSSQSVGKQARMPRTPSFGWPRLACLVHHTPPCPLRVPATLTRPAASMPLQTSATSPPRSSTAT